MSADKPMFALRQQGALREVDLAFADLLRRLGGNAFVQLAGALAMRAVALGRSGFALEHADRLFAGLQGEAKASLPFPDAATWAQALRGSALVGAHAQDNTPLTFEYGRVSLRRYARYESELAERILRHAAHQDPQADNEVQIRLLQRLFAVEDLHADMQSQAAMLALRKRLLLVTGGPGTGKTTTVARMIAAFVHGGISSQRIALAAPTGRAAARLGEAIDAALRRDVEAGKLDATLAEKIPRIAQTLHRLLGWQTRSVHFRHGEKNPLPFDVVVVDEASMVDLPLMTKLVAAVREDAKLILLGDPDQLPAVEAGDVLGALREADALAGNRVRLLRGWRQSDSPTLSALTAAFDVESEHVANKVVATLRGFDGSGSDALGGVQWRHGGAGQLQAALQAFVRMYREAADAPTPRQALQLAARCRVLAALRRGRFGAEHWNRWFAQQLGDYGEWFHGRLLMVAQNDYSRQLFNGDAGIVWDDGDGGFEVWFERREAPLRIAQLPAHENAFAITTHKAQGSEFDHVALLLPDTSSPVLNRELVYTAVTRAKRSLLLWADEHVLRAALDAPSSRDDGLLHRLTCPPANVETRDER